MRARVNPRIARLLETEGEDGEVNGDRVTIEADPRLPIDGVMVSAMAAKD